MPSTGNEITAAVLRCSAKVLDECVEKIRHCLDQLSDEQIWWRPAPQLNSIGNLILHLSGNLRQWIVSGLGGVPDVRDRPAEFAEKRVIPKVELAARLAAVVDDAKSVLSRLTADDMLARRRIQGFDLTGWEALFDTIPHFKGHTQEIVAFTRMQLGETYRFHWQPATPEQGAPVEVE